MLDVAMAHAARSVNSHAPGQGPGVATIEMKTSFLQAAEGSLRAVGKLLHRTASLAFCEGSVFNDGGELCAHGTATFKYLRALPSRGRHVKPLQRTEE
jgi:acyl-coenzyme A thioesterase PaaI-like protein